MRVLEGSCELHLGRGPGSHDLDVAVLGPGDVRHIGPGFLHRLGRPDRRADLRGFHARGLDDVVRLEDRYGRAGTSNP